MIISVALSETRFPWVGLDLVVPMGKDRGMPGEGNSQHVG
jgi:hypothetical protein